MNKIKCEEKLTYSSTSPREVVRASNFLGQGQSTWTAWLHIVHVKYLLAVENQIEEAKSAAGQIKL